MVQIWHLYSLHQKIIMDKYNQRVIGIEKSSFNPLVFTTTGGMAPENAKDWQKKIAEKRREPYASDSVIT